MSEQGFGGDDDDNRSDIERLLDGFNKAKSWYEENSDLFERFMEGGNTVNLAGGEPISEAHVDEDRVIIVADVSGVNATDLQLNFYDSEVEGKLGNREFSVSVPNDVDEDSIEADMKNGVLRVELERENVNTDGISVESVDHTDDTIGEEEMEELEEIQEEEEEKEEKEEFDWERYKDDGEEEDEE